MKYYNLARILYQPLSQQLMTWWRRRRLPYHHGLGIYVVLLVMPNLERPWGGEPGFNLMAWGPVVWDGGRLYIVNCWFGARWFGIGIGIPLRIPIPFVFGDFRNPNHQPKPLVDGFRDEDDCFFCFFFSRKGVLTGHLFSHFRCLLRRMCYFACVSHGTFVYVPSNLPSESTININVD